MINDSICCPTETTSFLAVTSVKPIGIEKTRKTTEELDKFWSIEMERQQLEIQRSLFRTTKIY